MKVYEVDLEQRILDKLQFEADAVRDYKEENEDILGTSEFAQQTFKEMRWDLSNLMKFSSFVLGKEIGINNWKIVVRDKEA